MEQVVTLRTRDVAVCLLVASECKCTFSKIQLQKLIYLMDVLSACLDIVSVENGHITYHHGPYDKNIQNAADMLVFWELADVINIRSNEKGIMCEYFLTDIGLEWIIELIATDSNTKNRYEICKNLVYSLTNRNQMKNLVPLVYAEPIFVKNKSMGYGVELNINDLNSNDFYLLVLLLLDAYQIKNTEGLTAFFCDFIVDYLSMRKVALATREWENEDA